MTQKITAIPTLQRVLELYNEYVNSCLLFDDPTDEIRGFDEYAQDFGYSKDEANEFFYKAAA